MPNHSLQTETGRRWLLLLLCLALVALPTLRSALVLDDPFHHGEYFASAIRFFSPQTQPVQSLTIHGALDFIPAIVARSVWGGDAYFFQTMAIYIGLNLLSALLLLAIAFELTRNKPMQAALLLSMAVAAHLMVGYRDLFLLASLYLFVIVLNRRLTPSLRMLALGMLGVVLAAGVYWSYDRGIAGVLSLGAGSLLLAARKRIFLVAPGAFVVSCLIISSVSTEFACHNYVENIRVLMASSAQWGYGFGKYPLLLTGFVALLNLLAIVMLAQASWKREDGYTRLGEALALSALAVIMFRVATNRADFTHVFMGLWMPMLLVFRAHSAGIAFRHRFHGAVLIAAAAIAAVLTLKFRVTGFWLVLGAIALLASGHRKGSSQLRLRQAMLGLLVVAFSSLIYSSVAMQGQYQWLARLAAPPDNASSSTEGVRWAAARLLESKASCVFDLSNNGVINGLTNLPACSRFTYPVYAGRQHEPELIEAMRMHRPAAIVYSSTYWSYSIDGRTMRARFPALDGYLLSHYPQMACANGYCIRYLGD